MLSSAVIGFVPGAAQETRIRGFADITYDVADDDRNGQFGVGQYDLFFSSRVADRLSFLSEIVFEAADDGFIVDVERVQAEYEVSPSFRVAVGRQHTTIGYWNPEFHHGALLEPTIDRPIIFLFEDEGGILATHIVGIRISGHEIGSVGLGYDVAVGNGIGAPRWRTTTQRRLFPQICSRRSHRSSGSGDQCTGTTFPKA